MIVLDDSIYLETKERLIGEGFLVMPYRLVCATATRGNMKKTLCKKFDHFETVTFEEKADLESRAVKSLGDAISTMKENVGRMFR